MLLLKGGEGWRHSRESGNPGDVTPDKCFILLDASFRWHDGNRPLKFSMTDY